MYLFISLSFTALLITSCVSEPKRSTAEPEWYGRMHRLSESYLNLTPLTASANNFSNPKNRSTLNAELKTLSDLGGEMARDPRSPNADPLIAFSAESFAQYSRQAFQAFKSGDFTWTRFAVQRAGDQCIACHTRADRGTKDFPLAWKPQLFNLNRGQRISFWLSNRQYSLALSEALYMAGDESQVIADAGDWMNVLEKVMTMVVRVEGSPRAAEMIVRNALGNKMVPFYLRPALEQWNRDIQNWRKTPAPKGDRERLKLAQILLLKPSGAQAPREKFVSNLRASALLHGLLENSKFPLYPDALESSGVASENLGEHALAQYYYESCIRELPHSTLAERCFSRLYSSLRDTNPFLDSDFIEQQSLQTKLSQLRELASAEDRTIKRSRPERDDPPSP